MSSKLWQLPGHTLMRFDVCACNQRRPLMTFQMSLCGIPDISDENLSQIFRTADDVIPNGRDVTATIRKSASLPYVAEMYP